MKGVRAKERARGRSRREVSVNEGEFVVCICKKIMKFNGKGVDEMSMRAIQVVKKPEGNVSGSLNDSLDNLMYIVIFQRSQMIASNRLLEPNQ